MKSALLLSKTEEFCEGFMRYLRQLRSQTSSGDSTAYSSQNSVKVALDEKTYFMFYSNISGDKLDDDEIPPEITSQGYCYSFLVECRSEVLFCEIVKSAPSELEFLVFDTNGVIFRPTEVTPEAIFL